MKSKTLQMFKTIVLLIKHKNHIIFNNIIPFQEVLMTTSNQLLSPYTVALRLRQSNQLFYMHLMGPKMPSYPPPLLFSSP